MDASSLSSAPAKSNSLFQVFLRLRPPQAGASSAAERFLAVETPEKDHTAPTHITLNPPNDRRRAVEKFAFTQVFEEDASQLDIFHCTGVIPLVEGVLAPHGGDGTDALLATLGVTGSGKSHTILGSKSQRGLTQLALDVIFHSLGHQLLDCNTHSNLENSIAASDPSEGAVCAASTFLDSVYADLSEPTRGRQGSRAPTPMIVGHPSSDTYQPPQFLSSTIQRDHAQKENILSPSLHLPGAWIDVRSSIGSPKTVRVVRKEDYTAPSAPSTPTKEAGTRYVLCRGLKPPKTPVRHFMAPTAAVTQKKVNPKANSRNQGESMFLGPAQTPSRRLLNRPSALPHQPDVSGLSVSCDPAAEYAVVISMYEVYNDRIFDLLSPPIKSAATKEYRRRPLLFKPTEASPDRKVVAGLRKVVCGSLSQALMVLEAGLHERRVAGTGSNSVSSRSHGFFCVEVKKRNKTSRRHHLDTAWSGSTLTIVDLAGSERARDAKTAGATLAEAGKINESLMYLGQCLQMQSDAANKDKPGVVPFRQCKLTELLFSNSFPSTSSTTSYTSSTMAHSHHQRRNPQKAVMIVTADPHGDFNATSQILRYSALAREITVPRIPSITQAILHPQHPQALPSHAGYSSPLGSPDESHDRFFSPLPSSHHQNRAFSPSAASMISATHTDRETMETAALEIARLAEEVEYLRAALVSEQSAREEAEAHLLSMEDRLVDFEQMVREDCAAEFERRLELEMARWKAAMAAETERAEEKWDRKLEIFAATIASSSQQDDDMDDGEEDKENMLVEDVSQENERLRRDNDILRRELVGMSPTKRMPLRERPGMVVEPDQSPTPRQSGLEKKMEKLRVSDEATTSEGNRGRKTGSASASPTKKVRKLGGKRWEAAGLDDVAADDDYF